MPQPPSDDPIFFDRSTLGTSSKKSSSPVFKILLAVFGAGFLMFACCAGWFGYNVYQGVQNAKNAGGQGVAREPGHEEFTAANLQISAGSGTPGRGNSDEARKLAEKFATDIRTLREAFFTKRKKKSVFSSTGEFLTYCHLDERSCVFLVHVPDLRKFTADAKSDLADLAWATAQEVLRSEVENPPAKLVVATRGIMLYDKVLVGTFQPDEESETDGIETRASGERGKEQLYQFFAPAPASEKPEPVDRPARDDGDAKPDEEKKDAPTESEDSE